MDNLFDNILDSDEHIIKVLKPNKLKFVFGGVVSLSFVLFLFLAVSLVAILVPDEAVNPISPLYCLIPVGIFVLTVAISIVRCLVVYSKRYYAYTNKRVIIRCGFIGVDYKSLDMEMIGAINVNVSLIDKMLHKNTGTISFGSVASPIIGNGSMFSFYSIQNPYEFYKEIKLVINEKKTNKPE